MRKDVFIVEGARTAIASPHKGLKDVTVGEMSAALIAAMIGQNGVKPSLIQEVILGNTVSAGTGQNFVRQAIHRAGLPLNISGYSINHVCASGIQSVMIASDAILAGREGVFIAGGAESATRTPHLSFEDEESKPGAKVLVDSLIRDGLWCSISGKHVGELCEDFSRREKIGRVEQDAFALQSHQKAGAAIKEGKFRKEIAAVPLGDSKMFEKDERPRGNISMEKLADLRPAFHKEGTITAGNASIPCDGAAALILAGRNTLRKGRLQPRARVLGYTTAAGEAQDVFASVPRAVDDLLKAAGKKVRDIDLFEIGESFAAQMLYTQKALKIPEEKMNIFGGDVALGHPLGAVGSRILVTLVHALQDQKKRFGLACVCAGGTGTAGFLIERV